MNVRSAVPLPVKFQLRWTLRDLLLNLNADERVEFDYGGPHDVHVTLREPTDEVALT